MYKIAIYGSSRKVLELYEAMKKDPNIEVRWVVDPARSSVVRKSSIPAWTIKDSLADIVKEKQDIFAVVNSDDDPVLEKEINKAGLDGVKLISGTSAAFIYETVPASQVKKEDYRKVMQELKDIAKNISMIFDKEKLLHDILLGLCEQTKAERGSIMLYDEKEKVLKVAMAYGIDRVLWDYIKTPIGEGIAGKVIETREPVLITGSPDDKVFKKIRKREDIKAAICVPLIMKNSVVGAINLASLKNINAFGSKDLDFVHDISEVVTEILFATRNMNEYREDAVRYKVMASISELVSEKIPFVDRLKKIVNYIKSEFGVYAVIAVNAGDDSFQTFATDFPMWNQPDIFWHGTIESSVKIAKKEICFLDKEAEGFRGYMAVPMMDGDECYGVMAMVNIGAPTEQKPEFFRELASRISVLLALIYAKENLAERSRKKGLIDEAVEELTLVEDELAFGSFVLRSLVQETAASIGVLRIYDEEKQSYVVKEVSGLDKILNKSFFLHDKNLVKTVLKRKRPLLVRNTHRDDQYSELTPFIQDMLVYPLTGDDGISMIFSLYNAARGGQKGFAPGHVNLMDQLFARITPILERIRERSMVTEEELIDPLTGLPNFSYFEKRVFEEVTRTRRRGGRLVILVAEMHPYDQYLKAYGKKKTDDMIRKIGNQIRDKIRTFEVVSRLNVNKFGIILVDADEKTLEVVFRLKSVFEKQNWDPKGLIREGVHIGYGYARFPEDGEEYDELIVKANHVRG